MSTEKEDDEINYARHVIWQLVGSTIVSFGGNEAGEILLTTMKNGVTTEFIIGRDEEDGVALFEVEHKEVPANA